MVIGLFTGFFTGLAAFFISQNLFITLNKFNLPGEERIKR
jgi:hypothetical protein